MTDADDYRIVVIGYDVQAKVAAANALVGYGSYIKQHMCRKIIVKKVCSKHMITGKFTMVVSPGFDTPRWPQVESRIKEYTNKSFIYVHKVSNVHTQGHSPSERIQSSFGKSLSYLVVYHDEVDNTTAQRKAQTLISQFGANYVCINANASRVTKFDITKQLLRAVSNVLKAKDRKLPPAMQTFREKNIFKVVQLKPARKVDSKASPIEIKKYAEDTQRLQTFATWPANVMLNPKLLCDAGFYYSGDSDVCICCRCNLALTDWNERHDPWVEHCRYSEECKFLSDMLDGTSLKRVKTDIDLVKTIKSSLDLDDAARVDIKPEASGSVEMFEGKHIQVDLTKAHWDLYNDTLNTGMVPSNHTRVNIVGHQGVGKTTLLKRLQQVAIKCPDPKQLPTEGIDVDKSITRCLLIDDTRIWHYGGEDLNFEMNFERMAQAMTEKSMSRLAFTGPVKAPVVEEYEIEKEYKESDFLVKETGKYITFKKDRPSIELFDDTLDDIMMGSEEMVDDMYEIPTVGRSMHKKKRDVEKQNMPDEKDYLQTVVDKMAYSQGSSIYLSFWDYAGQIPYYTTHQAFMSPLAVYLLVVDLSKTLDYQITGNMTFRKKEEETTSVLETLRFWNGSIRTYASTIHDTSAPVIIVGTHKDKVDEQRASDVFESIRKELQCEGVQCIAIDNTIQSTNNKAIIDLKNLIIDAGQDIIEKSIPAKWLQFEYQILKWKSEGKKIISFKTFLQLDDDVTEDYMENVLEYMHCKGLVIAHRSLPGMNKFEKPKDFILDPMILVRFLNLIMRRKSLEGNNYSKKKLTSLGWCSEGIFDERFVNESTKRDEPELDECINTLLEVLIHLKIAHPIDADSRQENRSFFMPCLLGQKPDNDYVAKSQNCRKTPLIRISFTRKSIPPTLYHSLIASLLSEWHPEKNDEDVSIFNNYGCFKIRGETTLLEIFWKDAYIYLYVVTFDDDLALDELEINALVMKIQQHINCILLIYRQTNVESEVSICCSKHQDPPSFLTFTELLRGEKVMCCPAGKKRERHAVDVKSALGGWFSRRFMDTITNIRGYEVAHQSGGQMTQTSLNSKILGRFARYLFEDATTLAKLVRIPQAYVYVESAINDSQGNSALARFFILEIWLQIQCGNATMEKLVAFITQTGFYHAEEILTQIKTDVVPYGKYKKLPVSMLESPPNDKHCDLIAKHVSQGDVLFFIELGIDSATIKNVMNKEKFPMTALLIMWKHKEQKGTVKQLIDTAAMFEDINVSKIIDSLFYLV